MTARLTLALPVDVVRFFDQTVSRDRWEADNFMGTGDDTDLLSTYIENAEGELANRTNERMRLSRAGSAGAIDTYEEVTYKVPGHRAFKRRFMGVSTSYRLEPVEKSLDNNRVLPFDPDGGDEAHLWKGFSGSGDSWDDITDEEGESWDIIDHAGGTLILDPVRLLKTAGLARNAGIGVHDRDKIRLRLTYRFGALGGDASWSGETELAGDLDAGATTTVAVDDAARLPTGPGRSLVLMVGDEYVRAEVDPADGEIDVLERGVRGTADADRSSGDRVHYAPLSVRKAVAARAAMDLVQGDPYSEWLPDTDDDIDKGEMLDNLRSVWEGTVAALGG